MVVLTRLHVDLGIVGKVVLVKVDASTAMLKLRLDAPGPTLVLSSKEVVLGRIFVLYQSWSVYHSLIWIAALDARIFPD